MLPAAARLRSSDDFRTTVRRGRRVGRPTVVLHVLSRPDTLARAGFVVSKAVGGAVTRNRVKRRLRHLVADRLRSQTRGVDVVVRALPAAATAPERLAGDFASAWQAAVA
ncbi:MAG TPA: ribonuclease P protein component [Propionibacteriaceae bacterium]|nr:ribonuclease P protein component [Propionibacteriaceae bacterium]